LCFMWSRPLWVIYGVWVYLRVDWYTDRRKAGQRGQQKVALQKVAS